VPVAIEESPRENAALVWHHWHLHDHIITIVQQHMSVDIHVTNNLTDAVECVFGTSTSLNIPGGGTASFVQPFRPRVDDNVFFRVSNATTGERVKAKLWVPSPPDLSIAWVSLSYFGGERIVMTQDRNTVQPAHTPIPWRRPIVDSWLEAERLKTPPVQLTSMNLTWSRDATAEAPTYTLDISTVVPVEEKPTRVHHATDDSGRSLF
jgi:hypothetical protein